MQLKDAVQEHRRKTGQSMRAIAIKAGIEPGLFNSYVQGKRPNRRNAERVATALNQDPRDLFQNFNDLRAY